MQTELVDTEELNDVRNLETDMLRCKRVMIDYKLSPDEYLDGLQTGYIRRVKAPVYVKHNNYHVISRAEMERYVKRVELIESLYYNYEQSGIYLTPDSERLLCKPVSRIRQLLSSGHYLHVAMPIRYRFVEHRRHYFHVSDLALLMSLVSQVARNMLGKTVEDGWIEERQLWQPEYPSVLDERFSDRYTEDTKRQVDYWRALQFSSEHQTAESPSHPVQPEPLAAPADESVQTDHQPHA